LFFFWSSRHLCIMNSLLKIIQSGFLSGDSEMSVGYSMKKATWNVGSCLLHYDNTPAHRVLSMRQFWQNIQFLHFHNPLIHLTSPLWTVLPKVKKAVGRIHCCVRGLFWRG
jgi:hypothetical protein